MSWDAYVTTSLVGTGTVSKAAIFGLNGAQWAASSGFVVRLCCCAIHFPLACVLPRRFQQQR